MANVPLIKDDLQPLNLPAGSIHLILAVAPFDQMRVGDPAHPQRKARPDAQTLIFTEFGPTPVFHLAQPAEEVFAAVRRAEPEPRDWTPLAAVGEDQTHYALTSALRAYEGFAAGGRDDGPWLRVTVERPGGTMPTLACAQTPENIAAIDAALATPPAGAAEPQPQPQRRRRGKRS